MSPLKDFHLSRPDYPEDVPEEVEDKIARAVAGDNGIEIFHKKWDNRIKFASVVYWTLESGHTDMSDRRTEAQKTAVDVFDDTSKSQILNICGQQAFRGVEYQPVENYVQNKWQRLFERLVRSIEHTEN